MKTYTNLKKGDFIYHASYKNFGTLVIYVWKVLDIWDREDHKFLIFKNATLRVDKKYFNKGVCFSIVNCDLYFCDFDGFIKEYKACIRFAKRDIKQKIESDSIKIKHVGFNMISKLNTIRYQIKRVFYTSDVYTIIERF